MTFGSLKTTEMNSGRAAIRYLLENPFSDYQRRLVDFQDTRREQYSTYLTSRDGMAGIFFSVEVLLFACLGMGLVIVILRNANKFTNLVDALLWVDSNDLESPVADAGRFTNLVQFQTKEGLRASDSLRHSASEIERDRSFFGSVAAEKSADMDGEASPEQVGRNRPLDEGRSDRHLIVMSADQGLPQLAERDRSGSATNPQYPRPPVDLHHPTIVTTGPTA